MIQLSTLPAANQKSPENSTKSAGRSGDFARHLERSADEPGNADGKKLPHDGKQLPGALPGQIKTSNFRPKAPAGEGEDAKETGSDAALAEESAEAVESKPVAAVLSADTTEQAQKLPLIATPQAVLPGTPGKNEAEADETHARRETANAGKTAQLPTAAFRSAKDGDLIPEQQASKETTEQQSGGKQEPKLAQGAVPPRDPRPGNAGLSQKPQAEHSGHDEAHGAPSAGTPRAAQIATMHVPLTSAVAAQAGEGGAPVNPGKADFAAGQQLGVRPHDFTTLVDRLFEARESARSGSVDLSVMHADFGEVSLKFRHDSGNLSVSMVSHDPEFARAVNAASAGDHAHSGDTSSQQGGRQDGTHSSSTRQDGGANASTGDGRAASGERRGEFIARSARQPDMHDNMLNEQTADAPSDSRGGIYA